MQYNILSTGSQGNAVLLQGGILVDCGVAFSTLRPVLRDIRLVLLTHRHGGWENALEAVMVAAKDDVSAERNEVATAGYALVHLRASYSWTKVRVDLGVENLFDTFHASPLGGAYLGQGTTMTTSPVGSVPLWGTAVPGAGRSIYVGVKVTL